MHCIDEGTGPPILMCHGNPTWSFLYRRIAKRFRDGFRCVAVDYLGFGLSDRPEKYGYTIAEHVRTVGELVDHLGLTNFVVMGQDWGGPIGTGVAVERHGRVRGLVLGNTWFWPATFYFALFSKIMSSRPLQRRIIEENFFVERVMPSAITRKLTADEMNHYRKGQPTPEARRGVAEMPKQILGARQLLDRLSREVPARLGGKRTLLVWGTKDPGFRPRAILLRMRGVFGSCAGGVAAGQSLHSGRCAGRDRPGDRTPLRLKTTEGECGALLGRLDRAQAI